ncbi:MAG: hypothetical protein ACOH1O_07900 [Flavobacterium sp.]
MEPNKYDKDFRTKLNNREISPSADSWNKLDAMLSATPKKKKKPMIWLYIAASILGFLFVGNLFTMQLQGGRDDIQVVNQDNPAIISPLEIPQELNVIGQEEIVEIQNQRQTAKTKESRSLIAKVLSPNQSKSKSINEEEIALINPPTIPQKVIRNSVSDDNLDKLLADASVSQKSNSVVKVSAKSLLSQVDGEIELTFREKMIRSVSKNYQEIKVAVSNRNLESY